MPRILQTDASLWKEEKTLSFSDAPNVWDSVWTGPLTDGSLPTYMIADHSHRACTLTLVSGPGTHTATSLYLPSIRTLFPHLLPWDGTTEHAVVLLAELLGYRRIFTELSLNTSIPVTREGPRPLFLITEYEKESFEKNLQNPYIDRILCNTIHASEKVQRIPSCKTFADVFSIIKTLPKCYVAFTRRGIVLDDWRELWSIPMKKTLLALLSYEVPPSGNLDDRTLPPCSDRQDSWVMCSEDVPTIPPFPLEQPKSECAFAFRMLQERFLVVNPARSLVTWRTLADKETLPGRETDSPVYHFIHPTGINERKPLLITPTRKTVLKRRVEGPDATRWLHAMSKEGLSLPLGISEYTHITQESLSLENCVQTTSGLAFDSRTLYVGSGKGAQEAWSTEQLYALLPTECHPSGRIVPFPEGYSPGLCILHVISKLLLLNEGVYVCPDSCKELFAKFGLTNTIPSTPERHIVYTKALCYPVDETISPEMIRSLRANVAWVPEPQVDAGRYTIVCANSAAEETLRGAWNVRVLHTDSFDECSCLFGAWGIVLGKGASRDFLWMLPLGARVFELSSTDSRAHTLSTVAGLRHIFTTESRLLESIADTP